jgi:hypothetical protein
MIPLLLIPQMILSGLLFSFDRLNNILSTKGKVPIVADMMASRWAYEAMAVYQFKNNTYEEPYFLYEKLESQSDFRASYLFEELNRKRKFIADNINEKGDSIRQILQKDLNIIRETIKDDHYQKGLEGINPNVEWNVSNYTPAVDKKLEDYLMGYRKYYQRAYNSAVSAREKLISDKENEKGSNYNLNEFKNKYHNESLADLVQNISEKNRLIEYDGQLIQQLNPIFMDPKPSNILDYRAQFFAPYKYLLGMPVSTYGFNVLVIWLMAAFFYLTLYFEWLRKGILWFEKVNFFGKVKLSDETLPKKK